MINLPTKDRMGNNFLSYSQIASFKYDKGQYYDSYILKKPFKGNVYTEFGNKVGKALEVNDYSKFNKTEQNVLFTVKRLDFFERKTILKYDDFYVIGFIDTISSDYKKIIDYKTGGKGKHDKYNSLHYFQMQIYALSIRQETGVTPEKASIEFIQNEFVNKKLQVSDVKVKSIEVDISLNNLKRVYWNVQEIAKEISCFYKKYK
jgi:CRISPR/Cas system-associated exonuclease Cas4 (RecB family)